MGAIRERHTPLAIWLFVVSCSVIGMVALGGWVRLTGSGLSMVDWHVVTGIVPPLSAEAWTRAFDDYRQTPEYAKINVGMTLDAFRTIYYREYIHRIAGRLAGLGFVLPLLYFLGRGTIPWRRCAPYLGIGLLFAGQGLMGWLMVQSGLVDAPHVSHYRLTLHLLLAVALLAACLWLGFNHAGATSSGAAATRVTRKLSTALLVTVCVQIGIGGLVAGLKAGHVAATFPKMRGQWVPDGLWALSPWISNPLANALTVHFEHRWFAFVILILGLLLWRQARREQTPPSLPLCTSLLVTLCMGQIMLGIATIAWGVPVWAASLHQVAGLLLFSLALLIRHRLSPALPDPSAPPWTS